MTSELSRPSKRATSVDVARRAGFSRSTVSQILNGSAERFPDETRRRVLEAADLLDYRPSRAGRALVTGLSDLVVVLVPNTTYGSHLQDSVDRIAEAGEARGLTVVLRYAGLDSARTLTSLLDLRPTAVVDLGVLTASDRDHLEAIGTRVLPKRGEERDGDDLDPVDIHIGRLQTRELLRHTPRMIAYAGLADGRLDPFGPPREEGVSRELAAQGLPAPLSARVPIALEGAVAALTGLLELADGGPLGIACYNDDVAIALLAAAREVGVAVPKSLAVIGVDHTDVGQLISPRLSTVRIDQKSLIGHVIGDLDRSAPAGDADARLAEALASVEIIAGETC
jgi:DNA-binding LacI/PurR family transcriptional regulator